MNIALKQLSRDITKGVKNFAVKGAKATVKGVSTATDMAATIGDDLLTEGRDLARVAKYSDFFEDMDSSKMLGLEESLAYELFGKQLSGKGKAAAYGIAGAVVGYGIYDGFQKGDNRAKMGAISADPEGLPNKVTANASPIQMSEEQIQMAMENQGGHVRDFGADGELAMSLHRLYGGGRQKFV